MKLLLLITVFAVSSLFIIGVARKKAHQKYALSEAKRIEEVERLLTIFRHPSSKEIHNE